MIKSIYLPYPLKDRSECRLLAELGADKILMRQGQFVVYEIVDN